MTETSCIVTSNAATFLLITRDKSNWQTLVLQGKSLLYWLLARSSLTSLPSDFTMLRTRTDPTPTK